MTSGHEDIIMNGMMDQETESGVDFSFDLLKYVNGDEDPLLWNDNGNLRYSTPETMLDPALITGMVLSPTPVTTSVTSDLTLFKPDLTPVSTAPQLIPTQPDLTLPSSFFSESLHNPWGEEEW